MDIHEVLKTTCILCMKPAPEVARTMRFRDPDDSALIYVCSVCLDCSVDFAAGERVVYNHLMPKASANLQKLIAEHGPSGQPPATGAAPPASAK